MTSVHKSDSSNSKRLTITLIMVMSANGVVAQKPVENSFEWNSAADRTQFLERIGRIGTVLMGSNTYRAIGSSPYDGTKFLVLTSRPEQFTPHENVSFLSGNAPEIYRQLQEKGLKEVALLGGPETNRCFFEANLINDIVLTLEPTLLPGNLHFVDGLDQQIPLQLNRIETLNAEKTLLLHYRVLNHRE